MKKILLPLFGHILAWAILFIVPYLIMIQAGHASGRLPLHEWIRFSIICSIFYLNFFFLIPRIFLRRKFWRFVLVNLAVALVWHCAVQMALPPKNMEFRHPQEQTMHTPDDEHRMQPSEHEMHEMDEGNPGHMPQPPRFMFATIFGSIFFAAMTVGIALAIRLTERYNRDEKLRQQLETEHLRSELSYLKLQLSPHFLFNTLNNIYALVALDPNKAQGSVLNLSKMLRYLLYETNADEVPIRGEVAFLQSYIQLMNLRLPTHVNVSIEISVANQEAPIAPLLLLSLIENAFKHGVHPNAPSFIRISLVEAENFLEFKTENTNHPKESTDLSGSGLGLVNLSKRLELMYRDRYQYHVSKDENNYSSSLSIQLR